MATTGGASDGVVIVNTLKDMIPQVSPFVIGPTGNFTDTDFDQYEAWAALELARIDPGVDSVTYTQIHALMICHIYETSRGSAASTQLQSEHIGDYSYTRKSEATTIIGSSTYYDRILQILKKWLSMQATTLTVRDDAEDTYPSAVFALDQSDVGVFE